jgi:hypothetical protein
MAKTTQKRTQIAAELEALAKRGRGRLNPRRIVEWAREHRASALHGCFTWDDSRAAHQYRLWQARQLIVSVEVQHEDGRKRQVYVSPVSSRGPSGGYRRLVDVMSDDELRMEMLHRALLELQETCDKYEDLCELAGVRAAVRLVRAEKGRAA